MANCVRCDASLSFFRNLISGGICSACVKEVNYVVRRLNEEIEQAEEEDGITVEFYNYVLKELEDNDIPDNYSSNLIEELDYQKQLTNIHQGQLPIVEVDAILEKDEVAHYEVVATYYKPNMQVRYVEGKLLVTSKKLYFITTGRDSMRIDWKNVVNVVKQSGKTPKGRPIQLMLIQVSKGVGGGLYHVPDSKLAVAIIETAVRLWKRHFVELKANPNTQGIPDYVKAAVFRRDRGQCVQCGYTGPYIEYDHILPRSKGGQNTVGNIQLLCGQCNRKKGNRI